MDDEAHILKKPVKGSISSIADFSENYSIPANREHQSRCFNFGVGVFFHLDDCINISSAEKEKLKDEGVTVLFESHFIISPDLKHDWAFVQHSFDDMITPYIKRSFRVDEHTLVTDGAPTHFKTSANIGWTSHQANRHGIRLDWLFRGTAHGKDLMDGEMGQAKNCANRETDRVGREGLPAAFNGSKDFYDHTICFVSNHSCIQQQQP